LNRKINGLFRTNLQGPNDARWIGAWWIGFLASGVLAVLATIPMAAFARELPEAKKHRLKDVDQVHAVSSCDDDDEMFSGDLKHLPKAIWVSSNAFMRLNYQCCEKRIVSEYIEESDFRRLYGSWNIRVNCDQRLCGFHA
jgi:hypothetical protein